MMSEHKELEAPRSSPTPWIAGGVVLIAAGLLAVVVVSQGRGLVEEPPLPRADEHPAVGKRLENVDLQPLTGGPEAISGAELSGHITLINFWGTWCPPCKIEFPHIKELEQHFRLNADFRFVSVSCADGAFDKHLAEETADFLKQAQVEFPTFHDPDTVTRREIMRVVGEFAYPTTLIIGRDGLIKAVWIGYAPGIEKQMREILDRELAAAAHAGEQSSPAKTGEN